MLLAVNIPEQLPQVGQAAFSIESSSSAEIVPFCLWAPAIKASIRSTVTDEELDGLRISIPSPWSNRFIVGLMRLGNGFWLMIGPVIAWGAFRATRPGGMSLFPLALAWLLFEGLLLYILGEARTGRHVILLAGKSIETWKEFGGSTFAHHVFEASKIRRLRFATDASPRSIGVGCLAIDYRSESYPIGESLTEYEVDRIIKTIRQRLPVADGWDDVEPSYRYAAGARERYGKDHPQWSDELETRLSSEWREIEPSRPWDEVKSAARHVWDSTKR